MSDPDERTRVWVQEYLRGNAQAGVLAALDHIPNHRVPRVQLDSQSSWAHVDAVPEPRLAVWLASGDVFWVNEDGSVGDIPIATVETKDEE